MTALTRVVRVLICEDSRTYAAALRRYLEREGTIEVVDVYERAEAAIAALPRVRPDLLTMDIELPGMSGLEAVEQIMSVSPVPILVLSSHVGGRSATTAAAALAAGALEAVAKDDLDLRDPESAAAAAFRRRVRLLAGARVIRHPRARLRTPTRTEHVVSPRNEPVVGIVASTGGPQALSTLLAALPADFEAPVLVVQHIATGFTQGLALWLDGVVPLHVQLARDGSQLAPGVWIAPEGTHLVPSRKGVMELDAQTRPGLHRPSGDVLLTALAAQAGADAIAVVLSGMGSDGAQGVEAVRAAGGITIAQDEQSSAIYGMPKAAVEHGAQFVLPLMEIAPFLLAAAGKRK